MVGWVGEVQGGRRKSAEGCIRVWKCLYECEECVKVCKSVVREEEGS